MADVGWAAATGLLHMAVVAVLLAPLIWWRARRGGYPAITPGGTRSLVAVAGVFLAVSCVLALPRVGFFADLSWNWQNKLLLLALLVLAVWLWPGVTWREVGLRRPRRRWWVPVVGAFVAMLGLGLLGGPGLEPSAETFLYQGVLPGLDEELMFRGLLLLLLHRALTARRPLWQATAGWEVPISCLLFGLVHGLHVTSGWQVDLAPAPVIATGFVGLLLVWVRIRWSSLIPAILTHNAINTAAVTASAFSSVGG